MNPFRNRAEKASFGLTDDAPTTPRIVINVPPRHAMTGAFDHLFDTTPSTPKDDPMSDITKATEALDAAKNGKRKMHENDITPAPKSEASEVIAPAPAAAMVKVDREDDDEAPSVMSTATKIVKLIDKHKSLEEKGRVLMCVVAGAGLSSLGGMMGAAGPRVTGSGEGQ